MTVYYRFHPLSGMTLRVMRPTRLGEGAVIVDVPAGGRLMVPLWMVRPDAAEFAIGGEAVIALSALVRRVDLIAVGSVREEA